MGMVAAMDATATSYHTMLPAPAAGQVVPEWVHLLPRGTFSGGDGRGPYTADPGAVVRASRTPMPLDENHATMLALKTGQSAPARGWITELQARPDGVWGRVDWTPSGTALMAERAYRGISPVFRHHPTTGAVSRILHASLTNMPNLELTALHSQDLAMDFLANLRQAMGLADTVDEAAVLAAATAQRTAVAGHAQQLAAVAAAAGLPADIKPDGLVTALQTQLGKSGARDGGKDALAEVVALQTQVQQLQAARSRDLAETAIAAAIAAGKPIPASRRDDFIARHMQDPAGTDAWLADMPSVNAGGFGARAAEPASAQSGIDASEAQVIALMGVDPEKFKAAKAAHGAHA